MNPQDNAYKLLGILQSYAPTGSAQQDCADEFNACLADGMSHRGLAGKTAKAIYDGLAHAAWPWNAESRYVIKVPSLDDADKMCYTGEARFAYRWLSAGEYPAFDTKGRLCYLRVTECDSMVSYNNY